MPLFIERVNWSKLKSLQVYMVPMWKDQREEEQGLKRATRHFGENVRGVGRFLGEVLL